MARALQRFSVRTAILAGFGALLLMIGLALAIVWVQGRKLEANYDKLRQDALPSIDALHSLNASAQFLVQAASYAAMVEVSQSLSRRLPHHDAASRQSDVLDRQLQLARAELLEAQADLQRALLKLDGIGDKDGPLADQRFKGHLRQIALQILADSQVIERQTTTDTQIAAAEFTGRLLQEAGQLRQIVGEALVAENTEIASSNSIVLQAIRSATVTVTVSALLALLIGMAAAYVISRGIANPIRQLRDGTRRVGRGELDVPIKVSGPLELQELAASFDDMTRQLAGSEDRLRRKERLASLGRMAATVSHELRNPLGVVRASIYTVKERTLNKGLGVERALERMERSIDRCVGIISDLMDFARVKDLMREPTNVDAWLGEFLAEQELPHGIRLRPQLACGACLSLDRERLERAVGNLIANAVQAMSDPQWQRPADFAAEIVVRSGIAGRFVEISVADTGPGIPDEVLPRIFDPLFTTRNFGVGLGLPLVRQILQQHRGSVAVERDPGCGATFILHLPLESSDERTQEKAA
jgi:signal transduction histidine kinase